MASQKTSAPTTLPSSVSISSQLSLPMPPPFTGAQRIASTGLRKENPVFQGSKSSTTTSAVTSNNDVSVLFSQFKSYMDQQNKTNRKILREIEDLKRSRGPAEDQTPLIPRVLDFVTPGSTAQQIQGSLSLPPESSMSRMGYTEVFQSGSTVQQQRGHLFFHEDPLVIFQDPLRRTCQDPLSFRIQYPQGCSIKDP